MITDRYHCHDCNYKWISFDDPVCCPACGGREFWLLPVTVRSQGSNQDHQPQRGARHCLGARTGEKKLESQGL